MSTEKLTEDLLKRLPAAATPEEYLDQDETLDRQSSDYLYQLLAERDGMKRADVVRASKLNSTVVYDIFGGKSLPGRDHAIMLAFGLRCSLLETQRLLRLAGVSELWPKNRRDAIVIWCVQNGLTLDECDKELWRLDETHFGRGLNFSRGLAAKMQGCRSHTAFEPVQSGVALYARFTRMTCRTVRPAVRHAKRGSRWQPTAKPSSSRQPSSKPSLPISTGRCP